MSSGSSQSLQLARGRHARSDQSFEPILEALRQLLGAFNAPVSVEANASGLLLRAEARTLAPWLAGPSAVALLSPVASAPGAPAAATAALLAADEAAAARCGQAFAAVRVSSALKLCSTDWRGPAPRPRCLAGCSPAPRPSPARPQDFERSHALPSSAAAAATVAARVALASALVDVARTLGCQEETVHDALRLLDRALGAGLDLEPVADPAHCAFALLLLCSRQSERHATCAAPAAVVGPKVGRLPRSCKCRPGSHAAPGLPPAVARLTLHACPFPLSCPQPAATTSCSGAARCYSTCSRG